MSAVVRQRSRIARVRHIQHDLAAAAAADAQAKVQALEASSAQLWRIRTGLAPDPGVTSGSAIGSIGELAQRLENARAGLELSIQRARELAKAKDRLRLSARITQESADKLAQRARAADEDMQERRMAVTPRARKAAGDEGEQN